MRAASSILDQPAVDPHLAQDALDRLARRSRETSHLTAVLVGACLVLAVLGARSSLLPLAAGAAAAAVMFLRVFARRQGLIALLVGQRSAYVIPEIARAGARLVTPQARRAVASALTRLVRSTPETPALEPAAALRARITAHAEELLAVASLLAQDGVPVHPSTVALLHYLLYQPNNSPLFNPAVPEQDLDILLRRIRGAFDEVPPPRR